MNLFLIKITQTLEYIYDDNVLAKRLKTRYVKMGHVKRDDGSDFFIYLYFSPDFYTQTSR